VLNEAVLQRDWVDDVSFKVFHCLGAESRKITPQFQDIS
jgi:hypothetical protein